MTRPPTAAITGVGCNVRRIREAYAIRSLAQHTRDAGWRNAAEIGAELRIHFTTVKRFAREGVLNAKRVNDKGEILFEPLSGPLPIPRRGKRLRDCRRYPKLTPHMRKEVQYEA